MSHATDHLLDQTVDSVRQELVHADGQLMPFRTHDGSFVGEVIRGAASLPIRIRRGADDGTSNAVDGGEWDTR